ncbi:MAG: NADH-quinone oxidoreductase subunit M [Vampirovibrionales bacterium]|nr:NADH-quinone oxidoreductase subunit M [Vampirovibrionales bacterium]
MILPEFITNHYLSILFLLPLLMACIVPLISEKNDGKYLHWFGIGGSALLFLYSALGWQGVVAPKTEQFSWIPSLGISYAVGSDGLTIAMVLLTTFLLLMACVASLTNIKKRLRLYYSMLFVLTTAVLGVFISRDFFLFFLSWELELIPMYLLIAIWGGPRRDYAAIKFVLYTLFGSIFLVAAILGIYFYAQNAGVLTETLFLFDSLPLMLGQGLPLTAQILLFSGLFITFAVKLPMVPFHTWLPDAHVEAPTPISMLLAGILLKMGAYGMLRFCFGFFPEAASVMAPYVALLAFINIVYTAGVALVQSDMKKLIAYSSVSHMGFVLLGLAALNPLGFNGAVFVMFSHGLVSAALFMCVGTLYTRTHSRQIADYGGFGTQTPIIFYFFLFMGMASLGLPLLVSFASESMVFYGAFVSNAFQQIPLGLFTLDWSMQTITILSALGVVIGAAYLLWLLKRVFYGPLQDRWKTLPDASRSEVFVLGTLAVLVLLYGFFPMQLTKHFEAEVSKIAQAYGKQQYVSVIPQKPCHLPGEKHTAKASRQ